MASREPSVHYLGVEMEFPFDSEYNPDKTPPGCVNPSESVRKFDLEFDALFQSDGTSDGENDYELTELEVTRFRWIVMGQAAGWLEASGIQCFENLRHVPKGHWEKTGMSIDLSLYQDAGGSGDYNPAMGEFLSCEVSTKTLSAKNDDWLRFLRTTWRQLERFFSRVPHHWLRAGCHIHVSFDPSPDRLNPKLTDPTIARKIAMASLMFQPAFDDMMADLPNSRREWAKSHDVREEAGSASIRDCKKIWRLLRNQYAHGVVALLQGGRSKNPDRYFWVNFKGFNYQTIEFRCFPTPQNETFASDCASLVIAFCNAALRVSEHDLDAVANDRTFDPTDLEARDAFATRAYRLSAAPNSVEQLKEFLAGTVEDALWARIRAHNQTVSARLREGLA
ncbi:hypothetical protein GGR57DRAFT_516261 [Xylariaceae sp. FL1272]|nr:hypothetical protein GGR57DRAFT_516261 [Xylariaceae sp. FL1272]